jgi:hypothetical protein
MLNENEFFGLITCGLFMLQDTEVVLRTTNSPTMWEFGFLHSTTEMFRLLPTLSGFGGQVGY